MSMTSHKWLLKTKTDINAVNPVRVSDNYGHYSLRKPSIDFLESVIFASQEASNEKVTAWSFFLSIDCMAVFLFHLVFFFHVVCEMKEKFPNKKVNCLTQSLFDQYNVLLTPHVFGV